MANDSSAIWQEIMANWQASQQTMAEQMLDGFQQWNKAFMGADQIQTNPIIDTYKTITESLFKNYTSASSTGFTNDWEKYLGGMPGSEPLVADINKLMTSGQNLFEQLTKDFTQNFKDDETNGYLLKALMDMSNPNSWLKYSGDNFDLSAHKLSEGPLFSGISDIDNRLAQVSDSWVELFNRSKEYHSIVFARWTQAYSRFIEDLQNLDEEQRKDLSPRKLVDLWSNVANEELLSLHRSEEFLNAQRAVIRSSMEYRLHEKNVAEVICEALHIPTRDEVDDLHKTVTELRRELRQTKASVKDLHKNLAQQFEQKFEKKLSKKENKH
ncbi:MAG: poly(R)-hydroxyalkanoic acid synthase subunit PhaE [Cellvibrionaceae bacterium]